MNFYRELPEGYFVDKVIDMKEDKKFAIGFNIIALLLAIISGTILTIARFGISNHIEIDSDNLRQVSIIMCVTCILLIAYMILHELVHGIAYKALTKEKLTFGLTLSCAFCGVPKIYTTKKTSLIALLAPFTFFSIVLLPLIFVLPAMWSWILIFVFALHFGGCVGDLYCTLLILFKYKGKKLLINDTGPRQTFYVLNEDHQ